jgi:hydroxymethylbilane synthase
VPDRLRLATRGSELALVQARHVAGLLRDAHPALRVDLVQVTTTGDRVTRLSLPEVGGTGLFTKEIEQVLLDHDADLAVHSLKDLPTVLPENLRLGAILAREDPRDVLISRRGESFLELPEGARLGTSSLRRGCQLRHARPDLEVAPLRGNVETRLRKLEEEDFDAIVLALAGLRRLGLADRASEILSHDLCLHAVGQGALAVEVRDDDEVVQRLVAPLHHRVTGACVAAERAFLRGLEGGCRVPIGAHADGGGGGITLRGVVAALDGSECFRGFETGELGDADGLGAELAERLMMTGAAEVIRQLRRRPPPDGGG